MNKLYFIGKSWIETEEESFNFRNFNRKFLLNENFFLIFFSHLHLVHVGKSKEPECFLTTFDVEFHFTDICVINGLLYNVFNSISVFMFSI